VSFLRRLWGGSVARRERSRANRASVASVQQVALRSEHSDQSERVRHPEIEDPVARFKEGQLWAAVMEEPWDTALAWSDAQVTLAGADPSERDHLTAEALISLLDEGLAYFFEFDDFGESYRRTPVESERLSREQVLEALRAGSQRSTAEGAIYAPSLGMRATEAGRERVFSLWPGERERWERWEHTRE